VDAAEAHFRLARWLAPEDAELAQDHGRVLAHLGEDQAALDAFEAAMRIQPDLLSAYLGAADIHERLGDPKAALRLLQEVRRRRRD
jgi:tetratricopeptide (TPR) repeat protein